MQTDFSEVSDTRSFVAVPADTYSCRIVEVRAGYSRGGDERWSVRLEVTHGDYAGRTAAWDSLTWSERGLCRVKHVLGVLGFDVTGVLHVVPEDLVGLCAQVEVIPEQWEDPITGTCKESMTVPFMGWSASGRVSEGEAGLDGLPGNSTAKPTGSSPGGLAGSDSGDVVCCPSHTPGEDGSEGQAGLDPSACRGEALVHDAKPQAEPRDESWDESPF